MFFLLFNSFFGFTQILSGIVLDETLNEPLPYANITLLSKDFGATTDEKGKYIIDIKGNIKDTLLISYLGYSMKKISLISFRGKKEGVLNITLREAKEEIDEVVLSVKKTKYSSSRIVGGAKKKRFKHGTQFGYETCVFIKNNKKKKGKLKAIRFSLKENSNSIFNTLPTYYRVKFYALDPEKDKPGQLLSYKDILYKPGNNTQNVKIELGEDYIMFPINGICVGIETIKPSRVVTPGNSMYTTAPTLVWVHSKTPNTWNSYRGKKWTKNKRKSVFKNKLYKNPLIQLEVQYRK